MEEYLRDPRFKAWGLSWAFIDLKTNQHQEVWVRRSGLKEFFARFDWTRIAVVAQNSAFDVSIMFWHYGVHPAFILDTLSMGRALHGVEAGNSLKTLAERYELPRKMDGLASSENILDELPFAVEQELSTYCKHDSWLCAELLIRMLPSFPISELQLIDMTVKMYTRPVLEFDTPMLETALKEDEDALAKALGRVKRTESELASNDTFADVLRLLGVDPPMKPSPSGKGKAEGKMIYAFAKSDAMFQQMQNGDNEDVALLCEARLRVKSTQARTRAQRFIDISHRGPLPVPLNYWGAGPGRWQASKGSNVNLQNMKRGSALRKSIKAPAGYVCIVGDLMQIEPRVLAELSDYTELQAIFRSGQDAYAQFGAGMFGVPGMTKESHPVLRQSAKSALLGAGYMLGWPSFAGQLLAGFLGAPPKRYTVADAKQMGISAQQVMNFTKDKWCMERAALVPHACSDDELLIHCIVAKEIIDRYRRTAEPVVRFWGFLKQVLEECLHGGATRTYKCLTFEKGAILMPNGMRIVYPELAKGRDERGRVAYTYRKGKKIEYIHPGTLCNNVTQGLARIVMSDGMLRVAKRLPVVLTVHDELAALARQQDSAKAKVWVRQQMIVDPVYLPGIPLDADVGAHQRYGEAKQ
jgi:DNA polymerase